MLDDYNTAQFQLTVSHLNLNELFSKKRSNLDELINILAKAEERSKVQVSFMTQDQTSRQAQIWNPHQNLQLIHDPQCFPNQ